MPPAPALARRGPLPVGRAVCYSGYRDGQSPDAGVFPSETQIAEDLRLLAPHFDLLRLYDCTPHAERVLAVIRRERLPFRVLLGGWLAAEASNPGCPWGGQHDAAQLARNARANEAEMQRLVDLARTHEELVFAVAVGNEAAVDWSDHLVPVARIAQHVRRVRAAVRQPVTVCDNYVPWSDTLRPLVAELDFISVHTYPVWERKPLDQALAYTRDNVEGVMRAHPGVPVVITEAGWTTRANGRGIEPEAAGEDLQAAHLPALRRWAHDAGLLCFLFEAFDERWKGSPDPDEPEKHWGLFDAERRPKRAMCEWTSATAPGQPAAV